MRFREGLFCLQTVILSVEYAIINIISNLHRSLVVLAKFERFHRGRKCSSNRITMIVLIRDHDVEKVLTEFTRYISELEIGIARNVDLISIKKNLILL